MGRNTVVIETTMVLATNPSTENGVIEYRKKRMLVKYLRCLGMEVENYGN